MKKIFELLDLTIEKRASDLHLIAGAPASLRINGFIEYVDDQKLTPEDVKKMIYELLKPEQIEKFEKDQELDMSYTYLKNNTDKISRFRINVYNQRNSVAVALRFISNDILGFNELGLPAIIKEVAKKKRGLILVTGATGSGKSTTLATMLDFINNERSGHIITLEDPIEYFHRHKKSIISQREIGTDSSSFSIALKEAMRQDPDVILVGEMRDLETIAIAITAAETGHLVLGTLHTTDAVQTIDRIIDVFPPYQQQQIRSQLSITLKSVIAQQLLLKADKSGRIPVVEIMIVTPAIQNLIREAKTYQVYSVIETGKDMGMQTLDHALVYLVSKKTITLDEALTIARDPDELKKKFK
ncbi:MAG: type IV pilus twitching motility protein PilT [Candidatus Omnitrophota bacterium]